MDEPSSTSGLYCAGAFGLALVSVRNFFGGDDWIWAVAFGFVLFGQLAYAALRRPESQRARIFLWCAIPLSLILFLLALSDAIYQ